MTGFIRQEIVESKACDLLKKHDLYHLPVNPVEVAEHEGVLVYRTRFSSDDTCGILQFDASTSKYAIYVNTAHLVTRQRFTIAHEIGHFILHRNDIQTFVDKTLNLYRTSGQDEQSSMETQANMFAAALLMPEEFVRDAAETTSDLDEMAKVFGVSVSAMGYRLANLGVAQ